MDLRKLLPLMLLGMCQVGSAQSPTYGIGRTPSAEEVRAWDISISPTGGINDHDSHCGHAANEVQGGDCPPAVNP